MRQRLGQPTPRLGAPARTTATRGASKPVATRPAKGTWFGLGKQAPTAPAAASGLATRAGVGRKGPRFGLEAALLPLQETIEPMADGVACRLADAALTVQELTGALDLARRPPRTRREPRLGLEAFQRGPPAAVVTFLVAFMLASTSPATAPYMRELETTIVRTTAPALAPLRAATDEVRKARDASYDVLAASYDVAAARAAAAAAGLEEAHLVGRAAEALERARAAGAGAAELARTASSTAAGAVTGAASDFGPLLSSQQERLDGARARAKDSYELTMRARAEAGARLSELQQAARTPHQLDVADWRRAQRLARLEDPQPARQALERDLAALGDAVNSNPYHTAKTEGATAVEDAAKAAAKEERSRRMQEERALRTASLAELWAAQAAAVAAGSEQIEVQEQTPL